MPALIVTHQQSTPLLAPSATARRRSSVLLDKQLGAQRRSSLAPSPAGQTTSEASGKPAFLEISEIADQIATYLDPASLCSTARVSRQWHAVSLRHLWRRAHLDRSDPFKESMQMTSFPAFAGFIRHLTLTGYTNPTTYPLSLVAPETLHLHSLKIVQCSELDPEALYDILGYSVNYLSQLQLMDISLLQTNPFMVSPLSSLSFKNLEQFRLVMAEGGAVPHNINQTTTFLTSEVLAEEAVPTVTHFRGFTDNLVGFLDKTPALKSLTAQGVKNHVDNAGIALNATTCLHMSLMHLDLHDSTVSGDTLGRLLVKCPSLVSLNISHTKGTHFLTGLVIPKETTTRHLKALSLQRCFFSDGHGFKELFRFACHVEKLDLSSSSVDDEALAVLGHNASSALLDLSLQACLRITDEGIRELLVGRLGGILQHLSIAECTELTGRSVHNVLQACSRLVSLDIHQPDILPLALFHLEQEDEEDELGDEVPTAYPQQHQLEGDQHEPETIHATAVNSSSVSTTVHVGRTPWACKDTLEWLRIKKLDILEPRHLKMLNEHLGELTHLRALHIGGNKLELSVLDGLGQRSIGLQQLFIDDLARTVTMEDLPYLMKENTPNLVRLWCRHLTRYSEPWSKLREERAGLKMW